MIKINCVIVSTTKGTGKKKKIVDELYFEGHLPSDALNKFAQAKADAGMTASYLQRLDEDKKQDGILVDRCSSHTMGDAQVMNRHSMECPIIINDTEKHKASELISRKGNHVTILFPRTKKEIQEYMGNFNIYDFNNHCLALSTKAINKQTGGRFDGFNNICVSFRFNVNPQEEMYLINQANNSAHKMTQNDRMKSAYLANLLPHEVSMEIEMLEMQSRMLSPLQGKLNFGRKCKKDSTFAKNKTCSIGGSITASNVISAFGGYDVNTVKGDLNFHPHDDATGEKDEDLIRLVCKAKGMTYPEPITDFQSDEEKAAYDANKAHVLHEVADLVSDYVYAIDREDDGQPFVSGRKKAIFGEHGTQKKWSNTRYAMMLGMMNLFVEKAIMQKQEMNTEYFRHEYAAFLRKYSKEDVNGSMSILNVKKLDRIGASERLTIRDGYREDMLSDIAIQQICNKMEAMRV